MKHIFLFLLSASILIDARNCCENKCLSFKKIAQYFCVLKARDIQTNGSGFLSNTIVQNLRVLRNDTTNGDVVAENIDVTGIVNVTGTIILDGEPIGATTISQYGYFTLSSGVSIPNTNRIPFDTTISSNGITNATGVLTFSESGFYLVNFTAAVNTATNANFQLAFDPAGAKTLIPNTRFIVDSEFGDAQYNGMTIIQIPTAGMTLGVLNESGAARTIDSVGGLPNVVASIQIIKLADL
jgi:hypothetical protein